jgi:hypothetical protein
MDFVTKEKVVLALSSPLSISIGEAAGTSTLSFALTSFKTELIGVSPDMSRVDSRIPTLDYSEHNGLSNQVMENLIEDIITETVTEISKGTIGGSLQEIKAAQKTQAAVKV